MKLYHKFAAIAFILFVFLLAGLGLLLPDSDYSSSEKRNLAQFPALSVSSVTDGSFMDGLEDWAADQFPFRDSFMQLKTRITETIGMKESQGVYRMKNGALAERFKGSDPENYAETLESICAFSEKYASVNQYFLLVPNAVSVYKENLPAFAPTEDQFLYIRDFYTALPDTVQKIDVRDLFRNLHAKVPLYYRTDHHWTTAGAYQAFLRAANAIELENIPEFTLSTVCNQFYGSLTSKSGYAVRIPDSLEVALPQEAEETYYTVTYVSESERTGSCYDAGKLNSDDPYQVFLGGNHPLIRIESSAASDRSILIIKDSYANAFIPFLIPEFAQITVLDPRYYYDDIDALMGSGFTDVLFLYNVNTFSEDTSLKTVLKNEQ